MQRPDFVVVGAGIVGLATAYALLKQGNTHVTVLEQAAIDHHRSPSRGLSRLLRFEYGSDIHYAKMVQLSLQRWQNLAQYSSRALYTPTRLLTLGNEGDTFTQSSYHILRELELPIRSLTRTACKQFFPQFHLQNYDLFIYNTQAAILYASRCLQTLRDLIRSMGGTILETKHVTALTHDDRRKPIQLHCSDGSNIKAERVALTIGAWVHNLLGELHLPIHITRQYLLYFANLPEQSFGLPAFPAFMAGDLYGFPIHNTCAGWGPGWLKVASHNFGASIDPNTEPIMEERAIMHIANQARQLLPALHTAQLAHVDTCMYDVSADESFIIDYLPDDPRIVFAAGLSGHGFKFGPLLGEMLSSLLYETRSPVATERFQLNRFTRQRQPQHSSVA